MAALLGRKVGMTQIFVEDGTAIPVTVIKAGPCLVVQRKTAKADGYEAVRDMSLSMMEIISGTWSVARGKCVAGRIPSRRSSSWKRVS